MYFQISQSTGKPQRQINAVQASILRSSEYVNIPNEETARLFNFCTGCLGYKESGQNKPIVCWHCWRHEKLPFETFDGTLEQWVTQLALINKK